MAKSYHAAAFPRHAALMARLEVVRACGDSALFDIDMPPSVTSRPGGHRTSTAGWKRAPVRRAIAAHWLGILPRRCRSFSGSSHLHDAENVCAIHNGFIAVHEHCFR